MVQGGLQTGGAIGRLDHGETVGLEVATHGHPDLGLVINDQDTLHTHTLPDITSYSVNIATRLAVGPEHSKDIKLLPRRI
ncbi:hypothetical protein Apa02nite_081470 [Actinoplanes palleronii]|uniref:Uncharacterized protein n=1 Tax=Actinoplanes palleronii TaxID=113570 RepID=A0ABQ4BMY5_9ACTN|nr:hypothetical protein Apa02nite_081470 [Actinoplanes palleronii]